MEYREIRHFHLFCGLGGAALGMQQAHARVGRLTAKMRCLGGVDVSAAAIRDFTRLLGVPGTVLDLFDREQYQLWHGHAPPPDWREATPLDIQVAAGGEHPHIVTLSAPCKGFSGCTNPTRAASPKYVALNALTLRGVWLMLEAFGDDPPELILFENVPLIQHARGRAFLDQIKALFASYDYACAETVHDCGEVGGLAQRRKRFLMVCRHRRKVPAFLYEAPRQRVRAIGEVLGPLPLPDDAIAGPMHRLPRLTWETWLRLALIPEGKDWRALRDLRVVHHQAPDGRTSPGVLADYALRPETRWHACALGVRGWDEPSGTIKGESSPSNGAFSVADPRCLTGWGGKGKYGVTGWDSASGTVIGANGTGQGAAAVADPRLAHYGQHSGKLAVQGWDDPARTVTGTDRVGSGAQCIADPRVAGLGDYQAYRVRGWEEASGTVTGQSAPGGGGYTIADPRLGWMESGRAHRNLYRVVAWGEAALTVTGASRPAGGGLCVADPRPGSWAEGSERQNNVCRVMGWEHVSNAVTAGGGPSSGGLCIADPRVWKQGRPQWANAGNYGVLAWDAASGTVIGHAKHDRGFFSIADPRLPVPNERPDPPPVIIALDKTIHRPLTTWELGWLQGLDMWVTVGAEPLTLDGNSHTRWREAIGNMIPPPAARAIGSTMAQTLLLSWSGESFMLSASPIWVDPAVATALTLDLPEVL